MESNNVFTLNVTGTDKVCAAGEKFARQCREEEKIPVFSCEGGCIKGEIARQAANLVAREDGYARACHGELFTAPHADLASWIREADRVVLIDGCSIVCHERIAENIIGKDRLITFNAFAIHGKYGRLMDIDDVPEKERKETAGQVASEILAHLEKGSVCCPDQAAPCQC